MRSILASALAGAISVAFSGAAFAQAASTPIKTDQFVIDAEGTIMLEDDFVEEINCVVDTVEPDIAEAAGAALAVGAWPANIDKDFQTSRAVCADDYDWSEREGQFAFLIATTQSLIDYTIDKIAVREFDRDDVAEIEDTLDDYQTRKFRTGAWLQDAAMVAKLEAELKARGLKTEMQISTGEMAVGSYANQILTIRDWVDLLTPK